MKSIFSTRPNPLSRRDFLSLAPMGLAGLGALTTLAKEVVKPKLFSGPSHPSQFPGKAQQVIVIFCSGALSQVDTFDYKPELIRMHGKPLPGAERLVSFQGPNGALTRPYWDFKPRGQCGKMISDLLPNIAELADDLCFIHSLTNKSNTHGPAENVMNTGFVIEGFPSMGSWVNFALGSLNENLPAFVAIEDPRGMPQSGPNNWANGFLPAAVQGVPFSSTKPIRFLNRPESISSDTDAAVLKTFREIESAYQSDYPGDDDLRARLESYQMAARMQLSVPEVSDISREPENILKLYGADSANGTKAAFARNCILARRLVEQGVRFVQLFNGAYASGGALNWDGHSQLESQYNVHGEILDQPVAGLLKDLKQRGMLESTLVVFATEFGRMPMLQAGTYGRDHNPHGFTAWLAGAGVRGGTSYGATDDFGFKAAEKISTIHDFHATILWLLGLDHTKLTYYHNGIERRLTDVHGKVIYEMLG